MSDGALKNVRARIAAAALVLVAIWEVTMLVAARKGEPSPEDWRAVAAAIPPVARDDQLILFAPRWLDPIGRKWLGDRISIQQAARMDIVRYREIWEVSVRGAVAPDVAREPAVSEQSFGALRLRRFVRDAPMVTWSLTEGARICEIDFEPRRGIVLDVHSRFDQGQRTFSRVELGEELQVYAGLADYKKRTTNQSRALIQVVVDGREVTHSVAGNDDGWVALPVAKTSSGAHDVDVIARAFEPRGAVNLAVCVAAEARTKRP